jgi:hypothetical protein
MQKKPGETKTETSDVWGKNILLKTPSPVP